MRDPQETAQRLAEALTHLERGQEALSDIPHEGELGVAVDGVEYRLRDLQERLRFLRDDLAASEDAG